MKSLMEQRHQARNAIDWVVARPLWDSLQARIEELNRQGFHLNNPTYYAGNLDQSGQYWQADHIVPVAEGGGECGLDNMRTLCTPCHKAATRALRKRLKRSC